MGYYIEGPALGKGEMLVQEYEATKTTLSQAAADFDAGFGIVFVVNNFMFEAAAFAYSKQELEYFVKGFETGTDSRPFDVYKMDRKLAEQLSGYSS
jgi:hypothetical protein